MTRKQVLDALRKCLDPEVGENIVDLGLIYGVDVKGGAVKVRMTLTTPGCPMHSFLTKQAEEAVKKVKGVKKTEIELVWNPPWTPEKMSEAAQKRLGWSNIPMAKQAVVDKDACIGCGLCASTCPKSFELGVDGKSHAINPAGDSEQCVQKAIDNCPVHAISWKK